VPDCAVLLLQICSPRFVQVLLLLSATECSVPELVFVVPRLAVVQQTTSSLPTVKFADGAIDSVVPVAVAVLLPRAVIAENAMCWYLGEAYRWGLTSKLISLRQHKVY
jgi:hypothetical protein